MGFPPGIAIVFICLTMTTIVTPAQAILHTDEPYYGEGDPLQKAVEDWKGKGIVHKSVYPRFSEVLAHLVNQFQTKAEDLYGKNRWGGKVDFPKIQDIYLIDSPVVNAGVFKRSSYQEPYILLTTGMLEAAFAEYFAAPKSDSQNGNSQKGKKEHSEKGVLQKGVTHNEVSHNEVIKTSEELFQLGIIRLAGVLSHEMGHLVVEKQNDGAFHQEVELLADFYGIQLLKHSKMPPEALYEAMRILPSHDAHNHSHRDSVSIGKILSTHPDTAVRASQGRLLPTLYRLKEGSESSFKLDERVQQAAMRDLEVIHTEQPQRDVFEEFTQFSKKCFEEEEFGRGEHFPTAFSYFSDVIDYVKAARTAGRILSKPEKEKLLQASILYSNLTALHTIKNKKFGKWADDSVIFDSAEVMKWGMSDGSNRPNSLYEKFLAELAPHQNSILAQPVAEGDERLNAVLARVLPRSELASYKAEHFHKVHPKRPRLSGPEEALKYLEFLGPKLQPKALFAASKEFPELRDILSFSPTLFPEENLRLAQDDPKRIAQKKVAEAIYRLREPLIAMELGHDFSDEVSETGHPLPVAFHIHWRNVISSLERSWEKEEPELQTIAHIRLESKDFWDDLHRIKQDHSEQTVKQNSQKHEAKPAPSFQTPEWYAKAKIPELKRNQLLDLQFAQGRWNLPSHPSLTDSHLREVVGRLPIRFSPMWEELKAATLPQSVEERLKAEPGNSCHSVEDLLKKWSEIRRRWHFDDRETFQAAEENLKGLEQGADSARLILQLVTHPSFYFKEQAQEQAREQKQLAHCFLSAVQREVTQKKGSRHDPAFFDLLKKLNKKNILSFDEVLHYLEAPKGEASFLSSPPAWEFQYELAKANPTGFKERVERAIQEFEDQQIRKPLDQRKPTKWSYEGLIQANGSFLSPFSIPGIAIQGVRTRGEAHDAYSEAILKRAMDSKVLNLHEKFFIFHSVVSRLGPDKKSDQILTEKFLPEFEKYDLRTNPTLYHLIKPQRAGEALFFSEDLRRETVKKVMANTYDPSKREQFFEVLSALDKLWPEADPVRDQYLDELLWKFNINDLKEIQDHVRPRLFSAQKPSFSEDHLRFLSGFTNEVSTYSTAEKKTLFDVLVDPKNESYRESLRKLVEEKKKGRGDKNPATDFNVMAVMDKLSTSSPTHRLPFVELVLNIGGEPLIHQEGVLTELCVNHLGYDETKMKALRAYLRSIPEHERGPSLAYLFSMQNSKDDHFSSMFELFSTVGIKTGQLISIWNLFGREVSEKLGKLKGEAHPIDQLDKTAILKILHDKIGPESFSRIQKLSKLGSASIKTVIDIEVKGTASNPNPQHVVGHFWRGNLGRTIQTNLTRSKRFLDELEKEGFVEQSKATRLLLRVVESQLEDEVNPAKEKVKCAQAAKLYDGSHQGWTVKVPVYYPDREGAQKGEEGISPVLGESPHVEFMEHVQGVPFRKLERNSLARKEAGELIVDSALKGLFETCSLNSDPHDDNFLVNPEKRILYPIDFGQFETGETSTESIYADDRYRLASFLKTLASAPVMRSGNRHSIELWAKSVLENGVTLTELSPEDQKLAVLKTGHEFAESLARSLLSKSEESPMLEGINHLLKYNLAPKKALFGILKGFLVLSKQEYVDQTAFERKLKYYALQYGVKACAGAISRSVSQTVSAGLSRAQGWLGYGKGGESAANGQCVPSDNPPASLETFLPLKKSLDQHLKDH